MPLESILKPGFECREGVSVVPIDFCAFALTTVA
jgi:hypothetical protein